MSTPQQGPQQPNFQPAAPQPQPQPYWPPQQPMGLQPGPAAPPQKPKRFGWLALGLAWLIGLGLGGAVGGAGGATTTTTAAKPAPTVTVTRTAPAADTSTDEPTEEPTEPSTGDTFSPKKSDFKLGVKTLSKECFGSAGCNVSFRIKPSYVGDQPLPTSGEIEVTYKITGLEDPVENTFTIDDEGTAHYEKEETGQTASKSDELGAKVTDVSYTP